MSAGHQGRHPTRGSAWPLPREIRITPASSLDSHRGLLAFARARFDAFVVDGIAIRRTLHDQRLEVSYPSRESRSGASFPHFLPTDPAWRDRFEDAVLDAFRREAQKG